jgi:hypothetical protein
MILCISSVEYQNPHLLLFGLVELKVSIHEAFNGYCSIKAGNQVTVFQKLAQQLYN